MTDKIGLIKAEVLRLKEETSIGLSAYDAGEENGKNEMCDMILSFIKSLPEDPVNIDFEQELYNHFGQVKDFTTGMRIAKYFYEIGRNHQEPVSNIWHDSNKEQPKDGSAVAVWNGKSGEIITQCVEVYSDRLWAYMDDLLYNSKEPKSDSYNREEIMRHLDELLISIAEYEKDRIIQEACDRAKNIVKCLEEPVSEELEE